MRLMQASKRKLELITKEKSPVRSPGFILTVVVTAAGAATAAHLAVALHRATDLIRLHATTIFFHRHF
jgi:IS5 family transposase